MLKADKVLTIRLLDRVVSAIAATKPSRTVEIDLSACERAGPFTEGRLIQVCATAFQQNVQLVFRIGRRVSPTEGTGLTWLESSAIGFILANSRVTILDSEASDVSRDLRYHHLDRATASAGITFDPAEQCLWAGAADNEPITPCASDLLSMPLDAPFSAFPGFHRLLSDALKTVGGSVFEQIGLNQWLDRFAFECIQNTTKHARYSIAGRPLIGARMLVIRRLSSRDGISEFGFGVRQYFEQLTELFGAAAVKDLFEITIADSGEGIPARYLKSSHVYGTLDERSELSAIQEAMVLRRSSEQGRHGGGAGLYAALHAVSNTAGLLHVTTGRLKVFKHYLPGQKSFPELSLHPTTPGLRPLGRGTVMTFVVPALARPQSNHGDTSF